MAVPVVVAEIERKFEPGPGFRLPDLSRLPGVAAVSGPVVHTLDATYYDTADLCLVAHRITLRRRTGGEDAGWHLKRPRADGDRDELRIPLGRGRSVPAPLRSAVEVYLRGAPLEPVVRLATSRTVTHLLDADGVVLLEIAEDDVTATAPAPGGGPSGAGGAVAAQTWHELEVELVGGDRALLDAVGRAVAEAGAPPSSSASKLSRALGDRLPAPAQSPVNSTGEPGGRGSAADVLHAHLAEHAGRLTTQDPLVRADAPDAVHQMRVATRRLRSALASYRPLFDPSVTDPLRTELRWLGEVLGHARDTEVIRDELHGLVAAQPSELVRGPVDARITSTLGDRYRVAHDQVLTALSATRYFALLDALDRLLAQPPLTAAAAGSADSVLLPLVAQTFRRLRRQVRTAATSTAARPHDELLHEVRKAAKRARYAGESMIPIHGRDARAWAARMEDLQECLGAHQDSVVIRAELVSLAATARAAGEDTFTYGRLHALEQARADATENRFDVLWAAARRPSVHRWLRG